MLKSTLFSLVLIVFFLKHCGAYNGTGVPKYNISNRLGYDKYSFLIDGERHYIFSGSWHYWRLPSPSLWRDIYEKYRAAGFNTATMYFNWDYHSPKSEVYSFFGVRDVQKVLEMAKEAGIYVIARPGPYINAETNAGGFPGWLVDIKGRARSAAPDYTAAWEQWFRAIHSQMVPWQYTTNGTIIIDQIENEYSNGDLIPEYMELLEQKTREQNITVPLSFNDAYPGGHWAKGPGAVDMYAIDNYPQGFTCSDYTYMGSLEDFRYYHHEFNPTEPLYLSEFQGGSFNPWGGTGFGDCYKLTSSKFEKIFYKSNIIQGASLQNYYMTYGGSTWGWLPFPEVYTSYDYGAAISEARQLTEKYQTQKLLGYMLETVKPITKTEWLTNASVGNTDLTLEARVNPDTGTQFLYIRQNDLTSTTQRLTNMTFSGVGGNYTVPQKKNTAIVINGQTAKILLAFYSTADFNMVYSTTELMYHSTVDKQHILIFYAERNEFGELVLEFLSRPNVHVIQGAAEVNWNTDTKHLRLNYVLESEIRVKVEENDKSLLLIFATEGEAHLYWRQYAQNETVIVRGSYLLRAAEFKTSHKVPPIGPPTPGQPPVGFPPVGPPPPSHPSGPSKQEKYLMLRGDTTEETEIEIFTSSVDGIYWNGEQLKIRKTNSYSYVAKVPGPQQVTLPTLSNWKYKMETFEKYPSFDDSNWILANKTSTNNPTKPVTLPVLYMDSYGFHFGDVWFRGHFNSSGLEQGITLDGDGGENGIYSVWLNGEFLGSTSGKKFFAFPSSILTSTDNVIAMLLENMGHNEDYDANDDYKRPRGFIEARLVGSSSNITWYIQGNIAGEDVVDFVRGQVNNGGLYGERHGWYLPGYPTQTWKEVQLPYRVNEAGVQWYRTSFALNLPDDHDIPIGVRIIDKEYYRYRALIFVNGWMMGHYINYLGPQHLFYVPAGILKNHQQNDIAIAVWNEDSTNGGLGEVILERYGSYRGGVPVEDVYSPTYQEFEQCKTCQFHNCKAPGINCSKCLQCNCDCSKCDFPDGYCYLRCGCNN
ncbi:hypothetical protein GpartN1_g422.t1 [Galdieria partita]|uniref:beta-galactosidase n=1 Tax=Galdieria partita TaxID=83374 RepID=A0A9C7PQP1_9RHOD|nr:hypothetical protein GpartN1_g422.t1 [Galdieria partita]